MQISVIARLTMRPAKAGGIKEDWLALEAAGCGERGVRRRLQRDAAVASYRYSINCSNLRPLSFPSSNRHLESPQSKRHHFVECSLPPRPSGDSLKEWPLYAGLFATHLINSCYNRNTLLVFLCCFVLQFVTSF